MERRRKKLERIEFHWKKQRFQAEDWVWRISINLHLPILSKGRNADGPEQNNKANEINQYAIITWEIDVKSPDE